jgi:ABC-type multidrug transport system ATPase subunit
VGDERRKFISGGERKRCAIGVEIITDPQVIMLDEPTSGLDSFTAVKIVKFMQNLARNRGKTIISTIHQPSSDSFLNFDRILLMMDGNVVYQGPAQESALYFNMLKSGKKNLNPCDVFMKILSVNYPKKQIDDEKIKELKDKYQTTLAKAIDKDIKSFKCKSLAAEGFSGLEDREPASIGIQTSMLFFRGKVFALREPAVMFSKLANQVVTALLMLMLYYNANTFTVESAGSKQ